jgi:hypothetical protein
LFAISYRTDLQRSVVLHVDWAIATLPPDHKQIGLANTPTVDISRKARSDDQRDLILSCRK